MDPEGMTPTLRWQVAGVVDVVEETEHARSIALQTPWPGHRPGQHVDVRLTAEDGYQAERSYSIASSAADAQLVLTVERIDDGEVSPYLADELRVGDEIELRGPIGGYFVWEEALGGPLVLIAGGSGIVPFRAMLRHRDSVGSQVPVRLLLSARSLGDVIYRSELLAYRGANVDVRFALTRAWPSDWSGYRGRVEHSMLAESAGPVAERPLIYVCGPTGFVELVSGSLVELGYDPRRIRTERFGGSG